MELDLDIPVLGWSGALDQKCRHWTKKSSVWKRKSMSCFRTTRTEIYGARPREPRVRARSSGFQWEGSQSSNLTQLPWKGRTGFILHLCSIFKCGSGTKADFLTEKVDKELQDILTRWKTNRGLSRAREMLKSTKAYRCKNQCTDLKGESRRSRDTPLKSTKFVVW